MRIDAGTSIVLFAQARDDFHEQTALEAVIAFLRQYGCPRQMTFDRDPRWVGSVRPGFPFTAASAFPVPEDYAPDLSTASARQECLRRAVSQIRDATGVLTDPSAKHITGGSTPVTEAFLQHYNHERPHQGQACGNVSFRHCPHYLRFQNGLIRTPG